MTTEEYQLLLMNTFTNHRISMFKDDIEKLIKEIYQQGWMDAKSVQEDNNDDSSEDNNEEENGDASGVRPEHKTYTVGLFSDVHFDNDEGSSPSEYLEDFKHAINYFDNKNVSFICSCGDLVYDDSSELTRLVNTYGGITSTQLHSCLGNHDNAFVSEEWSSIILPEQDSVTPLNENGGITLKVTNNLSNAVSSEGTMQFVLANPDKDGNYYGWQGVYNGETITFSNSTVTFNPGETKTFEITSDVLIGRNVVPENILPQTDRPTNILIYDTNHVKENIPVKNISSDVIFNNGGIYHIMIGGNTNSYEEKAGTNSTYKSEDASRNKFSYSFTKNGDLYIILSPYLVDTSGKFDTKTHKILTDEQVSQLQNRITDEYLNLHKIERSSLNNKGHDEFNYQFYQNSDLLSLHDLLNNNKDKRIFIFTHHYIPSRSGNNNPATGGYYAHSVHGLGAPYWPSINGSIDTATHDNGGAIVPYNEGAWWDKTDALCGIQMHFINQMINDNPNTIWFSGHSHSSWYSQEEDNGIVRDPYINICNCDFEMNEPSADVRTIKNEPNDIVIENFDANVYMRKSKQNAVLAYDPIKENTGFTVHLPSLSRPENYTVDNYGRRMFDSEGAYMKILPSCVIIYAISFKHSDVASTNYTDDIVYTYTININSKGIQS